MTNLETTAIQLSTKHKNKSKYSQYESFQNQLGVIPGTLQAPPHTGRWDSAWMPWPITGSRTGERTGRRKWLREVLDKREERGRGEREGVWRDES